MNDSDSYSPAEIYESANMESLNLLPKISWQINLKHYEIFMDECNVHNIKNLREVLFLAEAAVVNYLMWKLINLNIEKKMTIYILFRDVFGNWTTTGNS